MMKQEINLILLLIFSLSIQLSLFAQNKYDVEYNFQVDKVLEERISSFSELENVFKYDTADTLKMMYLANKSKEFNYLEGQSFALYNLGNFFRDKSFYNRAIAYHQNAYNLALSAENINLQVINLNMLGVVYRRIDDIKKALDYHQNALSLAESQEEITKSLKKSIAVSYNSIGNIYLVVKEPDLAIKNFNRSLSIENEIGNKLGLAMNYHNIGYAYEEKGDIDVALFNYNKSLEYNEEINSSIGKLICNNSIGQIYLKMGNPEDAIKILEQSLILSVENGDPYYITSSYIGLGWAQYELNKFDESEYNLNKGLEIAEDQKFLTSIAAANIHLSELYKRKGDYKLAFEKYLISDEINHMVSSDKNKQYVSSLNMKYETEKKNKELIQLAKENDLKDQKIKENRRNLFVALFGVLLLAGIFFVVNRQSRLKNEKKIISLEQDMLRSQMNPHFIF